ncbi:transmembrane protein 218-like [Gigantopelta aegis]|uniref:transmembrane protein 218-like n=1 Tax=Gigantopelta aegis TaxID=1735272 RepID=UPI001B8895F1|nr:transmembrane protein 218-like [Gigantopelta aegis]
MARVFGVGVGIFVLGFLWVLSLFICIVLSRAESGLAKLGPVAILGAILLTVILVFIPREPEFPTVEEIITKYDYTIIYRSSLLATLAIFLVVGLLTFVLRVVNAPVYAKPIRRRRR